jgi:broad specificity phosphatase PhoE
MKSDLILVKHSLPEIVPALPASQWRLSEEGRQRCRILAEQLAAHHPAVIVTSIEPKAEETGWIVAGHLAVPCETAAGLHEHERSSVGWLGGDHFEAAVARLFAQPQQQVFGSETADQAHQRFAGAITQVLDRYEEKTIAVVAHGTVIALFVARATGQDAFRLWKRLGLPSYIVLSQPELELVTMVEEVC